MKLFNFLLILISFFITNISIAQDIKKDTISQSVNVERGVLNIKKRSSLDSLLNTDYNNQKFKAGFNGYRIQIFSGFSEEKNRAIQVKAVFDTIFPQERSYLKYDAPKIWVHAGNFRSKTKAMYLFSKIKKYFPKAYMVKSLIKFEELKPIEETVEEASNEDENTNLPKTNITQGEN
ncbi:MAG: hypothetical protein N4A49_15765 [Marinifilaceae bacterium]|jgi:hypothetical protein|nr:hypothetical protein [Marinifilaceae bacterium]